MSFRKRFPVDKPGSPYAAWEEVVLSEDQELTVEKNHRNGLRQLMAECLVDAQRLSAEQKLKNFQSDVVSLAIALFEKRASHVVFAKEEFAQELLQESLDEENR